MIVKLTNNMLMEATHTALLDMPNIPMQARQCHLFLDMGDKALLSIAQFVDNYYTATMTHDTIYIINNQSPSM